MSSSWTKLCHPGLVHQFAAPIVLNNNEIILSSQSTINQDGNNAEIYKPGIYKYNIMKQKTSLFIAYADLFPHNSPPYSSINFSQRKKFKMKYHTMALDTNKQQLYLCDGSGGFWIVDLLTKSSLLCEPMKYIGVYPQSCFVDDKLHLIGGSNSREHLIWNNKSKRFDVEHVFEELEDSLYGFALIYVKRTNSLYLFSGIDGMNDLLSIYIYPLTTRKWTKSLTQLHCITCTQSIVVSPSQKYALIFNDNRENCIQRCVHVLDFNTMKISKTSTELPSPQPFQAILSSNRELDELLVFGYLRYIMLPKEIIQLILTWYNTDCVYLFDEQRCVAPQWCVALKDIMLDH